MRSQFKISLAALLLFLGVVTSWHVLRDREPVYQGKRLSYWLQMYGTNHWSGGRNGPLDKQIETAVRQVGTNAIPFYLRVLGTRESPFKRNFLDRVPQRWLSWLHLRNVYDQRLLGAYGLIALGPDAKSAVPGLVSQLSDHNPDLRYVAVFTLRSLGPVASDSLEALIKCLNDSEFTVRSDAILGLGELQQQPERVLPILLESLEKPQDAQHAAILRSDALWSIRQFGAKAKPAMHDITKLLEDPDQRVRSEATNILLGIDPEAAAKAGVEASP